MVIREAVPGTPSTVKELEGSDRKGSPSRTGKVALSFFWVLVFKSDMDSVEVSFGIRDGS